MEKNTLTIEEKQELLKETVGSDEARRAHATTWAAIINEKLPQFSTVRNIFTVDELPAGAVPNYQLDIADVAAWYLPRIGQVPQSLVGLEEVTVPTFEITSSVEYKIHDAQHGRINVPEKSQKRLLDAIVLLEENAGWDTIKAAVDGTDNDLPAIAGESGLTLAVINAAFEQMESRRDYVVTDIYVNNKGAGDIRKWTVTTIDPVTQREIFTQKGLQGIWQANIHVIPGTDIIPQDKAYFIDARPDKLGYMPIRTPLKTYDDPAAISKFRVRVLAYQDAGFTVLDPNRIVRAALTY